MKRDKLGRFTKGSRPERRTGKFVKCCECGKEIYIPINRLKKLSIFGCSRSCISKYRMRNSNLREKIRQSLLGSIPWNKGKKFPEFSGVNSVHWKGGRYLHTDGYIYIYSPNHPNKNKDRYVFEHRLVIEQNIGRVLRKDEQVHHINGNKQDNRIENLKVVTNSEHLKLEWKNKSTNNFKNSQKTWFKKGQAPWNKGLTR